MGPETSGPESAVLPVPTRGIASRLRGAARGGTASIVGSALTINILRIVSSMTLTRLLSAEAFGVSGIVFSVSMVIQLISDVGLYAFIVRHEKGDDARFLDEIWSLRLLRSAALTIVMAALSWPIAKVLGKPQMAAVLAVWSLNFIIEGLGSLAFATAVRQQKLWGLTAMEVIGAVTQLVVSILLALILHNYWALVFAMLAGFAIKAVISYTMFPGSRRRFVIDRPRARELWAFSRYIAMSSILTMLIMQSDKLVLARMMPLAVYGFYAIATTLATAPLPLAHTYTNRILFPAYSEAARADPPYLRDLYYSKRRLAALGYMFAAGGLIGGASLLVAVLYDHRYASVPPYLQLMAISTIVYFPNNAAEEALVASGRTRWTLYANIARIGWLGTMGIAALLAHQVMLLVAVVGTVEVAAMLVYWEGLRRLRLLNLWQEGLGFAAGAGGLALGAIVSRIGFALIG
ncbi:oligosaccharide flippase family protein [Sphingomonas bacterium]|uniref:oligosaccharide flippase family protein n=1 Tax=Sphingomonas bacterium TaxID=1895847 RepID=UPI001575718B|nr:oligosaccharide flippase family protein [Sphingomonas bacterium]